MIWLNAGAGCSEPRAPVAECVLSVCCCVLRVLVSDPGLRCSLALQDLKIALTNTPSVHPLFVLYCVVYYNRERESVCVCVHFPSVYFFFERRLAQSNNATAFVVTVPDENQCKPASLIAACCLGCCPFVTQIMCVCACARRSVCVLLRMTSPVLYSICSEVRVYLFCTSVLVVTKVCVHACVRA